MWGVCNNRLSKQNLITYVGLRVCKRLSPAIPVCSSSPCASGIGDCAAAGRAVYAACSQSPWRLFRCARWRSKLLQQQSKKGLREVGVGGRIGWKTWWLAKLWAQHSVYLQILLLLLRKLMTAPQISSVCWTASPISINSCNKLHRLEPVRAGQLADKLPMGNLPRPAIACPAPICCSARCWWPNDRHRCSSHPPTWVCAKAKIENYCQIYHIMDLW